MKHKLTISVNSRFKENAEELGHRLLALGYDVRDKKKGGISISVVIEIAVAEKIRDVARRDAKTSIEP